MIANLLPNEATHSSLDLTEKKTSFPFSLTVPSLLMDSKSQMPIVILRIKTLLEQNFLTAKEPRTHDLSVRDIVLKTTPLQ